MIYYKLNRERISVTESEAEKYCKWGIMFVQCQMDSEQEENCLKIVEGKRRGSKIGLFIDGEKRGEAEL